MYEYVIYAKLEALTDSNKQIACSCLVNLVHDPADGCSS